MVMKGSAMNNQLEDFKITGEEGAVVMTDYMASQFEKSFKGKRVLSEQIS